MKAEEILIVKLPTIELKKIGGNVFKQPEFFFC